MNQFIAALLLAHGVAHLVGFVGPWRLMDIEGLTWDRALLGGYLRVSEPIMRVTGVVWLLLAVGFFGGAVLTALDHPGWPRGVAWLAAASLVMCVVSWPASRIGVGVNLLLLAGLFAALRFGWV